MVSTIIPSQTPKQCKHDEKRSKLVLVDGNAARFMLLGLGDIDAQDTILEACGDGFLLNSRREVEAPGELANAAFGQPVLGRVSGLGGSGSSHILGRCASFLGLVLLLVGHSSLVRVALGFFTLSGGSDRFAIGNGTSGRCSGSVGALDLAADRHGLRVGELDVDILLGNSRKLAMELVSVFDLADIKLGLPRWKMSLLGGAGLRAVLARIGVKVVEKTEQRRERCLRGGVVKVAGEEGHCA